MALPKRRVFQHIMESRSIDVVRRVLPEQWVVREYRPDYGIDLTIELFEYLDEGRRQAATLGETLFVQVKATARIDPRKLRVHPRRNVELGPLREDRSQSIAVDVAPLRIDTSELLAVQAMSPAVPVLLLLVDLSTERVYFLCLNDFLDKVLLPADPAYAKAQSKVVHVPLRNELRALDRGSTSVLEFYAKRAKLYAAFQKFRYQHHELSILLAGYHDAPSGDQRARAREALLGLATHFLEMNLRLDFWTRATAWDAIRLSYLELTHLRDFLAEPTAPDDPARARRFLLEQPLVRRDPGFYTALAPNEAEAHFFNEVGFIWQRLVNLSGIFEELVREWFLPTYLSIELTGSVIPPA